MTCGVEAGAWQDGARSDVYYRDGARFALEGRLAEAAAAFEHTIRLDPKNGNAYYSLANVYAELGRWDDAIGAYRQALGLNKTDAEAYNGLGIALARRQLYGQAAEAFEKAISIYPKWAEPYFHLSQVDRKLRRDAAAQIAYNQAIQRRPDYAAHPPQSFIMMEVPAGDEARGERAAATESAVAIGMQPPAGNSAKRVTTPQTSAPSRAAARGASTNMTARPNSNTTRSYYDLGMKHGHAGRYEEAAAAFRQSIITDRNNAEAYFALGSAYAKLGRWRESVDAYEQAVRLNPKDEEAYERLGRSYAKLRETTPLADEGGPAVGVRTSARSGATADTAESREKNAEQRESDATLPASRRESRPVVTAPLSNAVPAEEPVRDEAGTRARPTALASESGVDPTTVYRVGAGDVLDVRVLKGREPRVTSYKVTPAGLLDYPPLGAPLQVAGLTTDEIAARLRAELKRPAGGAPEVTVGVREYASHAIIVSGLVKDSGTKILRREGVPLYVIIAHVQPLPEAGQALVVSHMTGQSMVIDLADVRAANVLVRPGDVITVQQRAKQYFYIAGEVREPGQKEFHPGLTLTQAVLAAGGVATATTTSITIARQGGDGRLATAKYDLKEISAGRAPDPVVRPGDRIEVTP